MIYKIKKGGSSKDWISKAVNPKHEGYCTPMTKSTCTPKRKALAKTFKSMGKDRKKHESGGVLDFLTPLLESFKSGGEVQYQDGIHNGLNIPKYGNAKKGAKLVKKKLPGTTPLKRPELIKELEKSVKKKQGGTIDFDISKILNG